MNEKAVKLSYITSTFVVEFTASCCVSEMELDYIQNILKKQKNNKTIMILNLEVKIKYEILVRK